MLKISFLVFQEFIIFFGFGTHLFVKVPRPGDSEVTFSGLRLKLPPVTTCLTTER